MEEQIRTGFNESEAAPGGLGSIFDRAPGEQMATVAAGPHYEQLPVVNLTVGDIRARLSDRFDIDPRSQASLDGRDVGDDEVVGVGQLLTFAHRAGEKGGLPRSELLERPETSPVRVTIEGDLAHTVTPEGQAHSMPLKGLLERILPRGIGTGEMVLPDGLKAILPHGRLVICVHQTPPRPHSLKWICADSKRPFGEGASYRTVRISLPYLVVMELFGPAPGGKLTLLNHSECFFRNKPLETLDDELLFPALLNCSKFERAEGKPLAWICTQYLDRSFDREPRESERLWKAHRALLHCLLDTGFNLSSEHHEGNSWFRASRHVDPRVESIEAWQEATSKDSLFALEVPWLQTGLSVRQMAERMVYLHSSSRNSRLDAANLVRAILNQKVVGDRLGGL